MKYSCWLPALFFTALSLVACSTNPVTGGRDFVLMSESQEINLGRQYSAEIVKEMPPYEAAALAKLVQRVGERLEGYTAIASAKTPWGNQSVRYAVIFRENSAWIFAAAAKQEKNLDQYGAAALETAKHLHPLTSTEKKLAEEHKLAIIRAPAGTRFAALARNSPLTNYPEEQLRLLNGLYPSGEPQDSQWLKVIQ